MNRSDPPEPVRSILPRVLRDMGLHDIARAMSLKPIKGGLRKLERSEDANAGMVVTDLETVPDEAA